MAITIHTITRYAVQLLTKKVGEGAQSYITLRLYDHDNNNRGIVLFSDYGADEPPKPTGDHGDQSVTAYLDHSHYQPYMDILRLEKPVYLKIGWTQQGRARVVAQVSLDTKKEVIGDFFEKKPRSR
jgi:hypothetical protein